MHSPQRLLALLVVFYSLALIAIPASAQYEWNNHPEWYKHYSYDSTFRIGFLPLPQDSTGVDLLMDSLRVDFALGYQGPSSINWNLSGADAGFLRVYSRSLTRGFQIGYPPEWTGSIIERSRAMENYWGNSDSLQGFWFDDKRVLQIRVIPLKSYGLLYAGQDTSTQSGTDLYMVGKPVYNGTAFFTPGGPWIYRELDSVYGKSYGNQSLKYHVAFTMKANTNGIGDQTKIAYAVLYYRNRTNQYGDCQCDIYTPLGDTLFITKEKYLDSTSRDAGDQFRDVSWLIDMVRDTVVLASTAYQSDPNNANIILGENSGYKGGHDSVSGRDTIYRTYVRLDETYQAHTRGVHECNLDCTEWLAEGVFPPGSIRDTLLGSDLEIRFYSKRVVPVTFLRTRISHHLFDVLRSGDLDTIIDRTVRMVTDSPRLDTIFKWFGLLDEPTTSEYRAAGIVSSKIQDYDSIAKRPTYSILFANYDGYRLFSGDLDSTRVKIIRQIITDNYPIHRTLTPSHYANPDSMSDYATDTMYNLRGVDQVETRRNEYGEFITGLDTVRQRLIAGNSMADYRWYTRQIQGAFGKVADYQTTRSTVKGPLVPNMVRAVDVGKRKYRHLGPPIQVWNTVDIHAWLDGGVAAGAVHGVAVFNKRPPTPEEISAQTWLSMACGMDAFLFSNMTYDGLQWGVMGHFTLDHSTEYDSLVHPSGHGSNYTIPRIWTGFASRYDAIRRSIVAMREIDSAVGWSNLVYDFKQLSVHDTTQSIASLPMVEDFHTLRAAPYDFSGGVFHDTLGPEQRDSTFIELTHFRPARDDTYGTATYAQYLLIVNRRTWPSTIGEMYDDAVVDRFKAAGWRDTSTSNFSRYGMGFIDVRRPVITLKNSTGMLADSFVIEKVGGGNWSRTVRIDTTVPLDWLKPGWGQLYRVRPVPSGVGMTGTSFNNGVHSENPSTDLIQRDRLTVYMRDSIVYLRATDSTGTWSREWMISDVADTVAIGRDSIANMHPTLATVRNDSALLIVWERRKGDSVTVEAAHFNGLPRRTNLPTPTRLHLTPVGKKLSASWMLMAPSVVGLDSGWAAAWGTPANGIEVVGIRNVPAPIDTLDVSIAMTVKAPFIKVAGNATYALGSAALYPTLAADRQTGVGGPTNRTVHMAWQQGAPNSANKQFIIYRELAAVFPSTGRPTLSGPGTYQHVSYGLVGCGYLHPSIAADSLGIAVAFQHNTSDQRRAVLRFLDTDSVDGAWRTAVYTWGGKRTGNGPNRYYERPSVTQFPSIPLSTINSGLQGALTWHWTNAADGVRNRQHLYRYRWPAAREIPVGQYPSMTLVPYKQVNPYDASSVFFVAILPLASGARYWLPAMSTPSFPTPESCGRRPKPGFRRRAR